MEPIISFRTDTISEVETFFCREVSMNLLIDRPNVGINVQYQAIVRMENGSNVPYISEIVIDGIPYFDDALANVSDKEFDAVEDQREAAYKAAEQALNNFHGVKPVEVKR